VHLTYGKNYQLWQNGVGEIQPLLPGSKSNLTVDGLDTVHVVWSQNIGYDIHYQYKTSGASNWSTAELIAPATSATYVFRLDLVSAMPSGELYLTWLDYDKGVMYTQRNAARWSTPQSLAPYHISYDYYDIGPCRIAPSSNGGSHQVFLDGVANTEGTFLDIFYLAHH
jgi:hypothetical protein